MAEELVLINDDGGVRTITFNRPDVLNAFNTPFLKALGKAVRDAERDKGVRCLVLTGAGRAFCSGQDLAEVKEKYASDEPLELGAQLRDFYNPIILRLRTMEKPVVASVNGVAAGAGCSFALAADYRIAAESATFISSFVHVGLVPDCGATFTLARLVGPARAFEISCTGRKVKSDEALAIGMVNAVVPDDQLGEATGKISRQLASMPPAAIALTKRAIGAAWTSDLASHLDYEAMLQTTAGKTEDHVEGVRAFLDKRKPVWAHERAGR
jgi:2-(1,2-epoxy-1,2-dihydrophenyl)acetyl-CoA isomerase